MSVKANVKDMDLYEMAKSIVYPQYEKPSAYRSGALVKKYKELYRQKYGSDDAYYGKKFLTGLNRWFKEEWKDVNPFKTKFSYPVYRPTKRITIDTPKTANEISFEKLIQQSQLKQLLKGNQNLPIF